MLSDLHDQKLQCAVVVKDLEHTQDLLKNATQARTSKGRAAYWQISIAGCIIFFASILSNFGAGFFFSTPPNPSLTYITLGLSGIFYILTTTNNAIVTKGDYNW